MKTQLVLNYKAESRIRRFQKYLSREYGGRVTTGFTVGFIAERLEEVMLDVLQASEAEAEDISEEVNNR
jgi:hypothetical protein